MNCPVCPRSDLPADALTCPNCGVDVGPARRLHELPERYVNDGLALQARGETRAALESFSAALQLGGDAARICVLAGKLLWREGRTEDALGYWRRALEKQTGHAEAQRLLEMAKPPAHASLPAWPRLAAVLALALVVVLIAHFVYRQGHRYDDAQVARLLSEIGGLRQAPPAAPAGVRDLSDLLQEHELLLIQRGEDRLSVTFREGLFAPGSDAIAPSAAGRMAVVAALLAKHCHGCRVLVQGVTDNLPTSSTARWKDNWTLGLARARSATDYLRRQCAGCDVQWLGITSGAGESPFPNDAEDDRRRNRTVVLHVSFAPNRSKPGESGREASREATP